MQSLRSDCRGTHITLTRVVSGRGLLRVVHKPLSSSCTKEVAAAKDGLSRKWNNVAKDAHHRQHLLFWHWCHHLKIKYHPDPPIFAVGHRHWSKNWPDSLPSLLQQPWRWSVYRTDFRDFEAKTYSWPVRGPRQQASQLRRCIQQKQLRPMTSKTWYRF